MNLQEENLLNLLENSYNQDQIYTRIENILISINPWKEIALTSSLILNYLKKKKVVQEQEEQQEQEKEKEEKNNDLFNLCDEIIQEIEKSNQSLLLFGESGSGKTEVFNQVISYFCTLSSLNRDEHLLEKKISMIPVILEFFGHRQKFQNYNSSRFAKILKLKIKEGKVNSVELLCSLLEKNCILSQSEGESNFHIFYTLFLNNAISSKFDSLNLYLDNTGNTFYRYINPNDRLNNPEDKQYLEQKFEEFINALEIFGIDKNTQKYLFQALAGIILLGNIVFKSLSPLGAKKGINIDDIECCVDDQDPTISYIAELFGKEDIANVFTAKVIQGGRASVYKVTLTGAQAKANVDSLAQGLYSQLFYWIINKVNESCSISARTDESYIPSSSTTTSISTSSTSTTRKFRGPGLRENIQYHLNLLDLMGFEDHSNPEDTLFSYNGFDQFIVNYCNEKLHLIYYLDIFSKENTLFTEELQPNFIPFGYDNNECIFLYENERGLLKLIDEHSVLSRANQDDITLLNLFCNTISSMIEKNKCFNCSLMLKKKIPGDQTFVIKHYTHDTRYSIQGFTSGNIDKTEVDESFKLSLNEVIVQSMKPDDDQNIPTSSELHRSNSSSSSGIGINSMGGRGNSGRTVQRQVSSGLNSKKTKKTKFTTCQVIKSSITQIFNEISNSKLHFIRSIKPNNEQCPNLFSRDLVLHQLKYSGIFDIIRMKSEGYNYRYKWNDLIIELNRRGCISAKVFKKVTSSQSYDSIKYLFKSYVQSNLWFEGKSGIVYLKSNVFETLKQKQSDISVSIIQKNWRIHRLPLLLNKILNSLHIIQRILFKFSTKVQVSNKKKLQLYLQKKYYFFIQRWIVNIKLRKRISANQIIRLLKYKKVQTRLRYILNAQERITNFLQTKRLKQKFKLQKKSTVIMQTYTRRFLCRNKYYPLILEVRERMYQRLLNLSTKKINSCYRNYILDKQFNSLLLALRWRELENIQTILRKYSYLLSVRDSTSGYKTLLHIAIECEFIEIIEYLLKNGASPFSIDIFGNTPLICLKYPPTKAIHAEILSLLLTYHKNLFDIREHEEYLFKECQEYVKNENFSRTLCKPSTLGIVLSELQRQKKRALGKVKHREAMKRGSTIIPLYDPVNWETPLPECLPAPDNAYINLSNHRNSVSSLPEGYKQNNATTQPSNHNLSVPIPIPVQSEGKLSRLSAFFNENNEKDNNNDNIDLSDLSGSSDSEEMNEKNHSQLFKHDNSSNLSPFVRNLNLNQQTTIPRRRKRNPDIPQTTFSKNRLISTITPLTASNTIPLSPTNSKLTSNIPSHFDTHEKKISQKSHLSSKVKLMSNDGKINSDAIYQSIFNEEKLTQDFHSQQKITPESNAIPEFSNQLNIQQNQQQLSSQNFQQSPSKNDSTTSSCFPLSPSLPIPPNKNSSVPQPLVSQSLLHILDNLPPDNLEKSFTRTKPPNKKKSPDPIFLDPQYRMLIARKNEIEKDPVLNFLAKSRPVGGNGKSKY